MKQIENESTFYYKGMAFLLWIRDLFSPRSKVLAEVEIKQGDFVLDFGCGPGGYIIYLSKLVGKDGMVFAMDRHPLALEMVNKKIIKHNLTNVITIHSYLETGLKDGSIDVTLLYDVFHYFKQPNTILKEIYRVLKDDGILSFSDHHMKEKDIIKAVISNGLFKLKSKNRKTYTFIKDN